jgi:V/A-type H+-transporting ATPase subunit E
MSAEQVVEKILSQARAEAQQILSAVNEAAQKENQRLDAELVVYHQETGRLADAAGADKLARILAAARMKNAKDILAAKGRILDELFARVKQRIEHLPDNEYLELMKRLLQKSIQTGQEEVIVGKNENRINPVFLERINNENRYSLRLAGSREDIGGGFILSSGKVRVNSSTDVLASQLRDKMEMELAAALFQ